MAEENKDDTTAPAAQELPDGIVQKPIIKDFCYCHFCYNHHSKQVQATMELHGNKRFVACCDACKDRALKWIREN